MIRTHVARAVAVLLIVSCGSGCSLNKKPAPSDKASKTPVLQVALVTRVGGVTQTESPDSSAWAGLQQAADALGAAPTLIQPKRVEDYPASIQALTDQKTGLIWAVGRDFYDVIDAASRQHPSQYYGLIDAEVHRTNVTSITYREEEGAFLMGVMAVRASRSKRIGFVGGMEIESVQRTEAGFRAGVKATDPKAQVFSAYAGTFLNSAKANVSALGLIDQGADVLFHAAGSAGVGVIEAARDRQKLAIGKDYDQSDVAPGAVLTSLVKRVDAVIVKLSKLTREKVFPGGEIIDLGLKEQGLVYSVKTQWDRLPIGTREQIDRWAAAIGAGKVNVPTSLDKLNAWEVPSAP